MRADALGDPYFLPGNRRTRRNGAIILFDFLLGDFGSDVTGKNEGDVVGTVIGFEPILNIFERRSVEILHGTNDGPGIGMAGGIGVFGDELLGDAVGLVLTLTLFVLNDTALEVEFLLIEHGEEMAHAIAFGKEDIVEHGGRNIFEIVGAIVIGGAVEVGGTDTFHGVDIGIVKILAAGEHEVFEEMGETGFAGLFVFGADVIPGVDGDDGGFVIFVHEDGEAVGEDEFGVGNVGDGDVVAFGGGDGGLRFGSGRGIGLREGGKHGEEKGEDNCEGRAGGARREFHGVLPEEDSAAYSCIRRKRRGTVSLVPIGIVYLRNGRDAKDSK